MTNEQYRVAVVGAAGTWGAITRARTPLIPTVRLSASSIAPESGGTPLPGATAWRRCTTISMAS